MKIQKIVLNIILSITNTFVSIKPIQKNRIIFVSLESNELESDLKMIYDHLKKYRDYELVAITTKYDKKSLKNNFLYLLNCIKQLRYINTSRLVIISDNNYVISTKLRKEVKVLQVWHASGAIKKFGNVTKREYKIKNYDYIVANSEYWRMPYSEAFSVNKTQIKILGMPRLDHLYDETYKTKTREILLEKYPICKEKKVILYAPTFRGNIYQGFQAIDFPTTQLLDALGDNYILLYKFHPLLKETTLKDHRAINVYEEEIHDLFTISDMLISDFSSIIFDFATFQKPMYFYVPDLDEYLGNLGTFIDYKNEMPGDICKNATELIQAIQDNKKYDIASFCKKYFFYSDGNNIARITLFIDDIMEDNGFY